jgi:hypothetical protein
MFLNTHHEYTDIKLQGNNDQLDTQQNIPINQQIPPGWNGMFLGYVPQGFMIIGTEEDSISRTINYANQNGKTNTVHQYLSSDTILELIRKMLSWNILIYKTARPFWLRRMVV